jgi:hypothetical protein
MNHFIEIRSLNLKSGTREEFMAGIETPALALKPATLKGASQKRTPQPS